jgi:hypothetical protein
MKVATNAMRLIQTGIRIGARTIKLVALSGGRVGLLRDGMFDLIKTMNKTEFDELIELVADPHLKEAWKVFMYGVGVSCQVAGYVGVVALSSPPSQSSPKYTTTQASISSSLHSILSFGSVNTYAQSKNPTGCQEALVKAMNDYMGIDVNKQINVRGYGWWQKGKTTKKIRDRLDEIKNGGEFTVASMEEAKMIITEIGLSQKHSVLIEAPHVGSDVATDLEKTYAHMNLTKDKKRNITLILPFVKVD